MFLKLLFRRSSCIATHVLKLSVPADWRGGLDGLYFSPGVLIAFRCLYLPRRWRRARRSAALGAADRDVCVVVRTYSLTTRYARVPSLVVLFVCCVFLAPSGVSVAGMTSVSGTLSDTAIVISATCKRPTRPSVQSAPSVRPVRRVRPVRPSSPARPVRPPSLLLRRFSY